MSSDSDEINVLKCVGVQGIMVKSSQKYIRPASDLFGLPRFAHHPSLTLGLRCARIDILSLTPVFFRTAT